MRPGGATVLGALAAFTVVATSAVPGYATGVTVAAPGSQVFTIYTAPDGTPGQHTALEPSIGADWKTGAIMYQALLRTLKVTFNDASTPATASWTDVSPPLTSLQTLDPILFTDRQTGRTFVSQLLGGCSASEFTNTDGPPWTPNQGCGLVTAFDHQTVGGGPFAIPPPNPLYPHAVYYCSQGVVTALCAFSVDGGLNYGPGVPIYTAAQCGGLHGHIRVGPDGTAIVPNQNCGPGANPTNVAGNFANQAAVVSTNDGATWSVHVLPGSHSTLRSDPSAAADAGNKWYFGYEDAISNAQSEQVGGRALIATSTSDGTGWSAPVDVGGALGVRNVTFPEVIAGDSGRAAYAFLGSTTPGNPENTTFQGTWELYMALTIDGGTSWTVSDLTPGDPVQRGCIYLAGNGTCPSSKRNLYDFMDITADSHGRVVVGFADGCSATCDTSLGRPCSDAACSSGATASTDHLASIAREACGPSLLARYANALACSPGPALPEAPWVPAAVLIAGAVAAGVFRLRRVPGPRLQ